MQAATSFFHDICGAKSIETLIFIPSTGIFKIYFTETHPFLCVDQEVCSPSVNFSQTGSLFTKSRLKRRISFQ